MTAIYHMFMGYGEGSQAPTGSFYSNSDMRDVWQKTKQDLDHGSYSLGGKTVQLEPALSQAAKNTFKRTQSTWRWFIDLLLFGKTYFFRGGKTHASLGHKTEITVIDRDAIDVAVDLKTQGFNPALLNPANAYTPGGGYKSGACAMEEDICRRSGLAYAIDRVHGKVRNFYTLKSSELLYNPDVPVFRRGRDQRYAYMDRAVNVSMITSAAIDLNPRHKANSYYHNNDKAFQAETERRIYSQLSVAADQKNDAVVLTAFGCGAFRNNPETVAKIYKKVIDTHFQGVFKKITFAVINDHNTGHAHNPNGNFKPFKDAFHP